MFIYLVVCMEMLFYCLHVANIFYPFRQKKSFTQAHRKESNMNILQVHKLQLEMYVIKKWL